MGTVTSNPPGIDLGGDSAGAYPGGTTVTLTPSPIAGSLFAGWSGGCTGTGICQVASTVTVTATFNVLPLPGTFTVTVLKGGTGTGKVVSTPTAIDCGAKCSADFFNNTSVTLTATADGELTFHRLERWWLHRHRRLCRQYRSHSDGDLRRPCWQQRRNFYLRQLEVAAPSRRLAPTDASDADHTSDGHRDTDMERSGVRLSSAWTYHQPRHDSAEGSWGHPRNPR